MIRAGCSATTANHASLHRAFFFSMNHVSHRDEQENIRFLPARVGTRANFSVESCGQRMMNHCLRDMLWINLCREQRELLLGDEREPHGAAWASRVRR
jgi:hypothetical protein